MASDELEKRIKTRKEQGSCLKCDQRISTRTSGLCSVIGRGLLLQSRSGKPRPVDMFAAAERARV
jgi:hypothetical protein